MSSQITARDPEPEDEIDPPSYNEPGFMLVRVGERLDSKRVYKREYEVLDYDGGVHWISEGVGFDYWLDEHCDFDRPGVYLISGITGSYIRGNWAAGVDDDEEWEFEKCERLGLTGLIRLKLNGGDLVAKDFLSAFKRPDEPEHGPSGPSM